MSRRRGPGAPGPALPLLRVAALAAWLAAASLLAGCGATIREQAGGVADFEKAKKEYDQENWADAALDLKAFVEAYPGTERTDDALYYLGDAYFRMKDYALASGQFDRLLRDFPASVYEPDARFFLARCDDLQSRGAMLDQTETDRAISRYREFLELHPDHARAKEAQERIAALRSKLAEKRFKNGRLYVKLHQWEAAERYFKMVVEQYPESPWAAEAALALSKVQTKRGFPDEALATLRAVPPGLATPYIQKQIDDRRKELEAQESKR